mmetsp:Transcript_57803/g.172537  ORF Transcript_57803/g.172537 Transcript_57803/m.172537 type:complete len:1082 (-) Transcript_57803:122-3367(-)
MPPLDIFPCLDTRPFADDDLQLPCIVDGIFRLLQLAGVLPLSVYMYSMRWRGEVGVSPVICEESEASPDGRSLYESNDGADFRFFLYLYSYVIASFVYLAADLGLLACAWSAASIGTPTRPHKRKKILRAMLVFKTTGMNVFLVALVFLGMYIVHHGRACSFAQNPNNDPIDPGGGRSTANKDKSWYILFCLVLVTQVLEIIVLPSALMHRLFDWLQKQDRIRGTDDDRLRQGERCIGCFFQCCGALSCFSSGGREVDTKGQIRDGVKVMRDFFNDEGGFNMVLSDLYFAFKCLMRVQRERRLDCINQQIELAKIANVETGMRATIKQPDGPVPAVPVPAFLVPSVLVAKSLFVGDIESETKIDHTQHGNKDSESESICGTDETGVHFGGQNRRDRLEGETTSVFYSCRGSVFALDWDGDYFYKMLPRDVLSPSDTHDRTVITEAAHFIRHANAIYDSLPQYAAKARRRKTAARQWKRLKGVFQRQPTRSEQPDDEGIELDKIGFHQTYLIHLQSENGIAKTPYCILVDKAWKVVIIAIRGTVSFEDIAIDLQLTPSKMDGAGKRCGFDASNQFCHRGILARSKWLYDDLRCHKLLSDLLLGDAPRCSGCKLVITGHSLGAGCATVLSLMLHRRFPTLRCYAFCPPGGLLTESLAEVCEDFVVSVVHDTDIIPRMSHDNLERLKDDSLEMFARINTSKIKLFPLLRAPINDKYLAKQNAKLFLEKEDISADDEFYKKLQGFRELKRAQKERSSAVRVPLYPGGKIIHLVKTGTIEESTWCTKSEKGMYTPQWAEKTDFNEILLSPTAIQDHSSQLVEEHLQAVLLSFAEGISVHLPEEDERSTASGSDTSIDFEVIVDTDFACCSRPDGNVVFLPSISASIALLFSLMSMNWCTLLLRTGLMGTVPGPLEGVDAVPPDVGHGGSLGVWAYMPKQYEGNGTEHNFDEFVDSGYCVPYAADLTIDVYFVIARSATTVCLILGTMVVIALWFAACVSFSRKIWIAINVALFISAACQGLVFVLFASSFCQHTLIQNDEGKAVLIDVKCSLGWGGKLGITSIFLWFFACITSWMVVPKKKGSWHS